MTSSQAKETFRSLSSPWLQPAPVSYNPGKKETNKKSTFQTILHFLEVCTSRKLQVTFPATLSFAAFPGKITIHSSAESASALGRSCIRCSPLNSQLWQRTFHVCITAWSRHPVSILQAQEHLPPHNRLGLWMSVRSGNSCCPSATCITPLCSFLPHTVSRCCWCLPAKCGYLLRLTTFPNAMHWSLSESQVSDHSFAQTERQNKLQD